jgi:HPt (histidine-containing phosphotransfer) domain-containing protein
MKKENIKKLANEIARLEKECQSGNNVSDAMRKIEQLTQGLSIEEMLAIDEYILEEKLLTK